MMCVAIYAGLTINQNAWKRSIHMAAHHWKSAIVEEEEIKENLILNGIRSRKGKSDKIFVYLI